MTEPVAASAPAWDRKSCWLLAALALLMLASLPFLVQPFYEVSDETNDASMYILSAQSLLRGEGYAYLGQPFIARPPGMSVMLAPIVAWRGLDFGAMHLLVSLTGIAGVLFFFAWVRPRVGPCVAAALGLALWLNPGYRHFCNEVMSDVPGMTAILAVFLAERWAARRPSAGREACLGVLIGLSTYVRTAGALLLPAILVSRAIANLRERERREPWTQFLRRRTAVVSLACVLVMLPWSVRNSLVAPPAPTDQNFIYSYWTGIFHEDAGDPGSPVRPVSELVEILPARAAAILDLLGVRLEGRGAGGPNWILGLWILASVAVVLARSWRSSEIYSCLLAVVLLTYFGFRVRLGLPMYVIGLAAWAEVHAALGARFLGEKRARVAVAATLLAVTGIDFQPRKGWDEIEREYERQHAQATAFAARLRPDSRSGARVGWHYSLLLDRPVWSLRFVIDRAPKRNVAAMEEVIDKYRLDSVLVGPTQIEELLLPYLRARYGQGERAGDGLIFRVRP